MTASSFVSAMDNNINNNNNLQFVEHNVKEDIKDPLPLQDSHQTLTLPSGMIIIINLSIFFVKSCKSDISTND